MDIPTYREAVAANRRRHGFEAVDADVDGLDHLWETRETDDTLGDVAVFAALVEADETDAETLVDTASAFRDVLVDRIDARPERADGGESATPIGYVTFATPDPDASLLGAMSGFTVARGRTNVFPLVYDTAAERLHRHEVPRLKGRGIYRRQADDAERLFEA
ncbi:MULTISPECIES: hypothetical protein [Halorubrum]|jgi:hypothetical protein|uniref:Uncharacterized protein n=3 Tax=Halorubrum ezzemoulense TaxID=337243 RepID=A0A256JU38_HALEZ|nr:MULTISPECIES: hypothetical protein [Halorubrum]MDB2223848.1 hypothetical protein [Halorubrum ezzemoulense]MDB2236368.1 hypothetical protein [Halorubrum ezzemoulense]MDB2248344.1 hypothetical protein [Halorubrum ezzemoulense]MDB2275149.1 hypothetical protein [Halorubrum ezzemoulense]MDB9233656.1 hypothetical protein [Halorubrum ezzemoulense]